MRLAIACLIALTLSAAATAAPAGEDCPMAHERYSSRSALLDLLIDPAAHAVLEHLAPQVLKPPFGAPAWPTQPPTFAAIVTPAGVAQFAAPGSVSLAALDAALGKLPLTHEVIRRRCARYDTVPPSLPKVIAHPAILVFEKITGFRDSRSVDAATAALAAIAKRRGFTLVSTDNGAVFNAAQLALFDTVVWNNVSGDALTLPQRAEFRRWIEEGGGFAGIHGSGGDPVYFWDWYADDLIGARFIGHPQQPQFQTALVIVEDRASPITARLPERWSLLEEWYSFRASPRASGAHVLARLDESSYSPKGLGGQDLHMGDHPIAWTRCVGRGRSFYTAIGHRPEVYTERNAATLLEQGIVWSMDRSAAPCASSRAAP
jgi:uncharacterized protein